MGKSSINGPFSMAMLNNQMVFESSVSSRNRRRLCRKRKRVRNLPADQDSNARVLAETHPGKKRSKAHRSGSSYGRVIYGCKWEDYGRTCTTQVSAQETHCFSIVPRSAVNSFEFWPLHFLPEQSKTNGMVELITPN